MTNADGLLFQVLFKNAPHGRYEEPINVRFQSCPRVGEYIRGIDPDEVYNLVQVVSVTHSPNTMLAGTLIVEPVPYEK